MSPTNRSLLLRYGSAPVLVLGALGVRIALDPLLADHAPRATFYAAIVVAGWYGGLGPALLALALGFVASLGFFILPPVPLEGMTRTMEEASLAMYLAVGLIIAILIESLRAGRRRAAARAAELGELHRQLEQRMQEVASAEQRVRAVVDNVVDGIITITSQRIIQSFNPAAERIFGYKAAEVIGKNVKMLMPEPDHSRHDTYVKNYLETGQAKIIGIGREVTGLRKDGSRFPLDLAVSEFQLDQKRMFVGIVRDVSQRRRAEQTFKFLADASATLAQLVDYESTVRKVTRLAIPFFADWCMVDMLEADGTLRRVAVAHSEGETTERFPQRDGGGRPAEPGDRHGPSQVARTGNSELIPVVTEEILREFAWNDEELTVLQSLGFHSAMSVPVGTRGKLLGVMTFASAEPGYSYGPADLAMAEDLAQRVAVAIENARLYAEVKDADHRKDEFLAMLAHELRNPLAPIRSGLDLLEMDGVDAPTAVWARTMMKQQVEHLVRLVDDLLDVSRIMRGKVQVRKERITLADVVNRGVETARPLIVAQGHQLSVDLPAEPVWIEADPVRMTQVVANLLNNAAKYHDKPGHVWVSAESRPGTAVIRVRDDGVGIEKDLLPRVFDLFTQAERSVARSQGGLGIGLTLVRSLVEMHGGSVEVRSEGLGRGSEFIVRLPALSAAPAPPPAALPSGKAASAGPLHRILVVDDNVAAARILSEIASRWHHDVRIAYTGESALEMAQTYLPNVFLLDIGLPGISGYEVAQRLRREPQFTHALMVAVTGYGQEEDRRRSREAGFDHHLVKPIAPEALYSLLSAPALAN